MNTRTFQNLLDGFRDNFSLLRDDPYRRPDRFGFHEDASAMRRDAERVASIVREKTDEANGKQNDRGKTQKQ